MVQETHSAVQSEIIWTNEWGGQIIFDHGETNSKGVAIMFRPGLNVMFGEVFKSNVGCFIVMDVNIDQQDLALINIYAPNEDSPDFLVNVIDVMAKLQTGNKVIGGDFNLVIDKRMDQINRKYNNDKTQKVLEVLCEDAMLEDVWRRFNPEQFRYTHFHKQTHCYARVDYIFVNYGLISFVRKADILPAYKSDHSIVIMDIDLSATVKRGLGLWKLNVSILKDIVSVKSIYDTIDEAIIEAAMYDPAVKWEHVKKTMY